MAEDCRFCRTTPNHGETACASFAEADKCSWFTESDRKAYRSPSSPAKAVDPYAEFRKHLEDEGHPSYWTASEAEPGVIQDRNGRVVAVVDVNNERSDAEAYRIALSIITAVNTCCGFRAEIKTDA